MIEHGSEPAAAGSGGDPADGRREGAPQHPRRRSGEGAAPPAGADTPAVTHLGLPPTGPGALASAGPRIAAFAIDALLSTLVAGLFTAPELPRLWSLLAFGCEYAFFSATFGQTPGMAMLRLGVTRVAPPARIGLGRAVLRTVLLMLLVPAVIFDSDGRGLHDRFTGTAAVRLR